MSDKMQRKMALKSFLESAGFKLFVTELSTEVACNDSRLNIRYKKAIPLDDLSELNRDLGIKSGLEKVLFILENFKEELMDTSTSQSLKDKE